MSNTEIITIVSWINTLFSIYGNFLVIKKKREGFIVWIISNMIWVFIDYTVGLNAQAMLFIVYTFISMYGYIKWGEEN